MLGIYHRSDYLRDHVTGPTHDDGVTYPNIFGPHLILVVEGCMGNGDPTDKHGFQDRIGRDPARPADRDLNGAQQRGALLRRELVGNGPPGRPGRGPEEFSLGKVIHLGHGPIYVIRQVMAMMLPVLAERGHLRHRGNQPPLRVGGEPPSLELRKGLLMTGEDRATLNLAQLVTPHGELPSGGDRRVLLA